MRNISKTFGATRALRHVEFSIDAGEVFAVLRQNGSGNRRWPRSSQGSTSPIQAPRSSSTASRCPSSFGNGTPEIQPQLSPPGNTVAIGQISSYADWAAYEVYHQTALVLADQPPRPYADTFTPDVLTTPATPRRS